MNVTDLVDAVQKDPRNLGIFLAIPPAAALVYGLFLKKGGGNLPPHKYVFSFLIYMSCIPGVMALVLTGYEFLFLRSNLMALSIGVYFLPVMTMGATLGLISRRADFDMLPGFERISGLFTLFAATFITALILDRMRILILFHGSVSTLLGVMVFLFLALKYSAVRIFKGRER